MKIYTSYYANLRNIPDTVVPVGISRVIPNWFKGPTYQVLAPSWDMVKEYKETGDEVKFAEQYADIVSPIDEEYFLMYMEHFTDEEHPDVVLLSWEKTGEFSHRNFLPIWGFYNGIEIEEWVNEKTGDQ